MGTTCSLPAREVAVPSKDPKVIKIKQTSKSTPHDEIMTYLPPKKITVTGDTRSNNEDEEIKTDFTFVQVLKYSLRELGIGEYYLEKEIAMIKDKTFMGKDKNVLLNAKWERVINKMRQKIDTPPHEDFFYNHIDMCLKEYAILRPQKYLKLSKKGPPMRFRWSFWKNNVNLGRFYKRNVYERLKRVSSTWEATIKKDLSRSFPEEPYFSSNRFEKIGQDHLFNVLKALSLYFPNIGYTQSMNFLVGFFLLVNGGNELEAFWMFVTLAREHKFLMMGLFEKNLPLLEVFIFIFYELLEAEMPLVCNHLKQQQLLDQQWLFKWFMTGFIYSLPPKHVIRIWDFLLQDGILGIIKVALGIIKIIEKDLLSLDMYGIDQLFKHLRNPKETPSHRTYPSERENTDRYATANGGQNQSLHHNTQINGHEASVREREHAASMVSIHNETADLNFSFQELDINKVIKFARKVNLSFNKASAILDGYFKKTNKLLPPFYKTVLVNWGEYMRNTFKSEEFQREIEYYLLKTELSEPVSDEIIISNLLETEVNNLILKDLGYF